MNGIGNNRIHDVEVYPATASSKFSAFDNLIVRFHMAIFEFCSDTPSV